MLCLRYIILLFSCFTASLQRSTPQDDHYVAAVVEYQNSQIVEENLRQYIQLIAEAARQNADIIVFPELTLTNGSTTFGVPINGILQQYPVPASYPDLYDNLMVSISQAARDNQIYVVINGRELVDCRANNTNEECPEAMEYVFNTNVVFDRNGSVIDRYRKINLFGERSHTPALHPDLGVFTTDFGVTFGHFICFDLMFQVPATQLVQKLNITDVIFTTMWFSELPYLTAVQIQEAYAYSLNVNFLASGANNVGVGSAGSGIYSGRAGALISIMPGVPTTRLLVSTVPKVPGRVTQPVPGPIYDTPLNHDNLLLISDPSLPSYVSRLLVDGLQEFTLVDRDVSCYFRIRLHHGSGNQRYRYRAAAFSGVRSFSGVATGGSRVCSVVACSGDEITTCTRRFSTYAANATAEFIELIIQATFPTPVTEADVEADNSAVFPVSSTSSIMPLEPSGYSYAVVPQGNVTRFTLILNNFSEELYSFALWGRYFAPDGEEADPPIADAASSQALSSILLISALTLILRN